MTSEEDRIWEIKDIIENNIYYYELFDEVSGAGEAAVDILRYIKEHYVEKKM